METDEGIKFWHNRHLVLKTREKVLINVDVDYENITPLEYIRGLHGKNKEEKEQGKERKREEKEWKKGKTRKGRKVVIY